MEPGNLVAGRFEIERLAGRGGMALVYRARDVTSGAIVAVKILHDDGSPHAHERFARETAVLADLTHPAIVRHVAHGRTERGQLFLAMEWLEGSTLSALLKRGGLVARDAVELVRRVAEGLGSAHARGFLHRDVKPSNILLVGDDVRRVKLVDFGVAHLTLAAASGMTRTGVMLGTPGYMAPEQARGDRGIDARADVFSLGCVLFECLAGRPPFYGDNLMAVLAKILVEEVPRVSELEPTVLPALDALVARMLSKDLGARPVDARAVAIELAALGDVGAAVPSPRRGPSAPPAALTIGEQRVLTIVLAGAGDRPTTERGTAILPTLEPTGGSLADLRAEVARHGGRLEKVLGGSLVATFLARGAATDQVAQAARCALEIRKYLPNSGIAIATGRGQVASAWPVGEAIDRAAAMLRADADLVVDGERPIRVDDTTAGLLDGRFEVGGDARGLELVGEREADASLRTLLGRPIPCIGREREISQIQQVFDECIAEPVARAVLVTAPPGVGKSRIRYEVVRAAQYREGTRVEIWIGRGDPVGAGAAFGLIGQAIARAAGIRAGEPLEVRRRKLRARVARNVPAADAARISEFLGEVIGAPFNEDDAPASAPISKQLRAARDDARLMGDQMRRAFEDFVAAECAVQPVMLVLEDLQWGDVPTVQLVDAALRHAAERPFFVFAVGRPEVREMFPRLWEERGLVLMLLRELKKSSAEKIVREVLGQDAEAALVADLVERAGGNAFYLEELVRAVAAGKGASLPETVLAMIEVRLESLEPEARQVLRAASVFGQVFWSRGVGVLLGDTSRTSSVADWLDELVAREIVQRRRDGRFPDEPELVFRHALVREGAYAMLTENDRRLGHRLAGKWLRAAGETNALVLAEHFEKGELPEEAVACFRAATLQALEGNDLRGVIARAERGVACGAAGEALGELRLAEAEAHGWLAENAEAETRAIEAMDLLPKGSPAWFTAAGITAQAAARVSDFARLGWIAERLVASSPGEGANAAFAGAAAQSVAPLLNRGKHDVAAPLLARLEALYPRVASTEPGALAWILNARSWERMMSGDLAACLDLDRRVAECFEEIGDLRHACEQRGFVGYDMMNLGAYAEAEVSLRESLVAADRMQLAAGTASARHNLGMVLSQLGRHEEALVAQRAAIEAFAAQGYRRMEGAAHMYLALTLEAAGQLDEALAAARRSVELMEVSPANKAHSLGVAAQVLLALRDPTAALEASSAAMALLESLGAIGEGEALVRLAHAASLEATGDHEGAVRAIEKARELLLGHAERIGDARWRESFLTRIPENARTLELAARWSKKPSN